MLMRLEGPFRASYQVNKNPGPEGKVRLLGQDQATTINVWLKSKKSCVDSLVQDDAARQKGRPIFNAAQRKALENRAGKGYKVKGKSKAKVATPAASDFPERRQGETMEAYVDRARSFLAAKRA